MYLFRSARVTSSLVCLGLEGISRDMGFSVLEPVRFKVNWKELVTLGWSLSSNKAPENQGKEQLLMEILTLDSDLDLVVLRVWKWPGELSFS